MLTLLSRTNTATAEIPPKHVPSFTDLESLTGYSRSTLIEWLKVLTESHWVARIDVEGSPRQGMRLTAGDPNVTRPKRSRATKKPDASYRRAVRGDGPAIPPGDTDRTAQRYSTVPPGGTTADPHLLIKNSPTESSNPIDLDQSATSADDAHDGTLDVDFGAPAPPRPRRTRKSAPKAGPGEETEGQRLNRVTNTYTDVVKLTHFHKAKAIVKAAFAAGYSEQQIVTGLRRLAEKEDPLSKETLRIAIVGRPSWERSNDNGRRGERTPYLNPDAADQDAVYDPAKL